jgi:hypothetical protein
VYPRLQPFWDQLRSGATITDKDGYTCVEVTDKMRPFSEWHSKDDKKHY